ncbi:MAG TPA: hypothetical protein VGT44_06230 [Ktedonobacteraceae bacterium]|nr:hypothetical protein [Ktedonobacteraceae bacterium]
MIDGSLIPTYDELAAFIADKFATLRKPYMEWANLARRAVQGQPYDMKQLATLERFINEQRAELRTILMIASEHLDEAQLALLRAQACMSKNAWKSLKKRELVNLKDGFRLISY